MKEKIIEFKSVIITLVICLAILGISKLICSLTDNQYTSASETLSQIRNQISSINTQTSKEVHVTKPFTDGLDKERWKNDNNTIYSWVADAFTFNNSTEYNEHRNKYLELLGPTHQFLTEILVPYEAVYADMKWEQDIIDDGTNIKSSITSLKSYVVDIGSDNGYTYLAILERTSTASSGSSRSDNIVLTYTIDADGNVSNFRAATPKIDK